MSEAVDLHYVALALTLDFVLLHHYQHEPEWHEGIKMAKLVWSAHQSLIAVLGGWGVNDMSQIVQAVKIRLSQGLQLL